MELIYTLSRPVNVQRTPDAPKDLATTIRVPLRIGLQSDGKLKVFLCEQHEADIFPTADSAKAAAKQALRAPDTKGPFVVDQWMRLPAIPGEPWGLDANAGRGETPLEHFAEVADELGWDDYSKLAILSRFIHEHGLTKLFAHYVREQLAEETAAGKEADTE